MPNKGHLLVASAAAMWGTWPIWLRLSGLDPRVQTLCVMTTLGVVGAPLAWATRSRGAARPARAWALMALIGLLDAGNNLLYFAALGNGPVAIGVLSHYLAPVAIAALGPRILGERLGRRTPVAIAVALLGLVLMLEPWGAGAAPAAAALGAASAVFYASNVLCAKLVMKHFTSLEIVAYHTLVSALLVAPLGVPHLAGAAPEGLAVLAVAAVALGMGSGLSFVAGLRLIPAHHAGVLTYLEPLVAVAVGATLYGERLGPLAALGGILTVAAGVAVVTEPKRFGAAGTA